MKLLPKKEINVLKAKERKLELDEGLKLARRIDGLRETLAKEQSNIQKFQAESFTIIRKDIADLLEKKQILIEEIRILEEKKNLLTRTY